MYSETKVSVGLRQNTLKRKTQAGSVLAVSLLILLVLTLIAVTAMDGSSLGYKMSMNSIYHEEAFNNSESARTAVTGAVVQYLDGGEDWASVNMPDGLSVDSNGGQISANNGASENIYNNASLQKDFSYSKAGITADIYVLKGPTSPNTAGAGSAQLTGYSGGGIGAGGAGGVYKYYEMRSNGTSKSNAKSWTAVEFRHVPK